MGITNHNVVLLGYKDFKNKNEPLFAVTDIEASLVEPIDYETAVKLYEAGLKKIQHTYDNGEYLFGAYAEKVGSDAIEEDEWMEWWEDDNQLRELEEILKENKPKAKLIKELTGFVKIAGDCQMLSNDKAESITLAQLEDLFELFDIEILRSFIENIRIYLELD